MHYCWEKNVVGNIFGDFSTNNPITMPFSFFCFLRSLSADSVTTFAVLVF
jgi:hypothetical protein